jgi:hypothetical protein
MLERLPESKGNVVGFLIRGKLNDGDYRTGLIPPLEEAVRNHTKIRILFRMEDFEGWTAHGAWDDFINWPKFVAIEKMAIVIDENWHEFMTWLFRAAAKITHIDMKFFKKEQVADAWDWLRAP